MKYSVFTLLIITLFFAAGCASTQVETARQLEHGELVQSVNLDWPGAFIFPSYRALYGMGPGDISAHAGTALLSFSGAC